MPIDFNGLSSNSTNQSRSRVAETTKSPAAQSVVSETENNQSPGSEDNVRLSDNAKALHQLEEHIKKLPDVDQEKVNFFRDAIANGSYQPNAENIAEKMLGTDLF